MPSIVDLLLGRPRPSRAPTHRTGTPPRRKPNGYRAQRADGTQGTERPHAARKAKSRDRSKAAARSRRANR